MSGPIGFSIDPSGEWSPVQLKHVLAIVQPEAKAMGLELLPVELTTHNMPIKRFILVARCCKHGVGVAINNVCPMCARGVL